MKKGLLYLISLFLTSSTFGQINEKHNSIRVGDEIIKQQVDFKEPSEAGINQLWDFSKLKTIYDSYSLTYSLPALQGDSLYIMGYDTFAKRDISDDELIVGTEHNTMHYYRLKDGVLQLLGHENPSVKLRYTEPIPKRNTLYTSLFFTLLNLLDYDTIRRWQGIYLSPSYMGATLP